MNQIEGAAPQLDLAATMLENSRLPVAPPQTIYVLWTHTSGNVAAAFGKISEQLEASDTRGKKLLILNEMVGGSDEVRATQVKILTDRSNGTAIDFEEWTQRNLCDAEVRIQTGDAEAVAQVEYAKLVTGMVAGARSVRTEFEFRSVEFKPIDVGESHPFTSEINKINDGLAAEMRSIHGRFLPGTEPTQISNAILSSVYSALLQDARCLHGRNAVQQEQIATEKANCGADVVVVVFVGAAHRAVARPEHRSQEDSVISAVIAPELAERIPAVHSTQFSTSVRDMKVQMLANGRPLRMSDVHDVALSKLLEEALCYSAYGTRPIVSAEPLLQASTFKVIASKLLLTAPTNEKTELYAKIIADTPGKSFSEVGVPAVINHFLGSEGLEKFKNEGTHLVRAMFQRAFGREW